MFSSFVLFWETVHKPFFSFLEEKEREESLVPTGIKALSCHASSTDSDIKLNLSLMEIVFPISTMQSPV